jgi:hypothetical protein
MEEIKNASILLKNLKERNHLIPEVSFTPHHM